jgi:hypothetical protein
MDDCSFGEKVVMDFKKLMTKASTLAREHSDKLGPFGKKAAGLLGNKAGGESSTKRRPSSSPSRTKRRGARVRRPALRRAR